MTVHLKRSRSNNQIDKFLYQCALSEVKFHVNSNTKFIEAWMISHSVITQNGVTQNCKRRLKVYIMETRTQQGFELVARIDNHSFIQLK